MSDQSSATGTVQGTAAAASDQAHDVAGHATDQAQDVAGHAAEQAQEVAGHAAEQARQVAGQAGEQARNVLGETRDRLTDEAGNQVTRIQEGLRALVDELGSMADRGQESGQSGLATDLARRGQSYAGSAADWLEGREPGDLVAELRSLARRRPGVFLGGALVAGVLAGRLTRGAVAASHDDGPTGGASVGGAQPGPAGLSSDYGTTEYSLAGEGYGGPSAAGVPGESAAAFPGTAVSAPYDDPAVGRHGGPVTDDLSPLPNRPGSSL